MLRVSSSAIIIPPFDCAWLSLQDYQLNDSFCLQFECKGENDVTVIFKPFPGAKRWQHLQRQQGPAGGEQLAVEANYTVILGSHRNSKLKIEKNGEELAVAVGLPGCTVTPAAFTACWINYSPGCIAVGTGPMGSSLSYLWQDPEPAIHDIKHIGLSCWDKHVSYRNVQVLPPLPPQQLQELRADLQIRQAAQHSLVQPADHEAILYVHQQQQQAQQRQQASSTHQPSLAAAALAHGDPSAVLLDTQSPQQQQGTCSHAAAVPDLLQLVQHAIVQHMQPADVCHMLQLSEALLPRTQHLYRVCVELAGEWFSLLVQQHLQELAMLPLDVLVDVLHEPLLDVSELAVFEAVAAWCQAGGLSSAGSDKAAGAAQQPKQPQQLQQPQQALFDDPGQPPQRPKQHSDVMLQEHQHQQAAQPAQPGLSPQQQRSVELEGVPGLQDTPLGPAAACGRAAEEVIELLQLVRFALMSEVQLQAVREHPFTQACPAVQQCLQEDLQRLQDHHSGHLLSAGEGGFRCLQRRLLLPACAADSAAANAAGSDPAGSRSRCNDGTDGGASVRRDGQADGLALQQQQRSAGSASGKGASGWLARGVDGSSSSMGNVGPGNGWRSYRRRLAPSCKELMFVCVGDRNGVIHYIATEYSTKPWVNPVLSKALEIKASSPASRYTDPKALVSGQFINTSFAGPRYVRAAPTSQPSPAALLAGHVSSSSSSQPQPSTWWQLDLGPQHRLLCNYYVIRHDGSQEGFARSWALQGSNDLQHWLDLRRHTADTTIRLPGQYGSWPVGGPAACMPFRAFRLLLTGPTQSQSNPWAFCLSYWELYGYFYKLRDAASSSHGLSCTVSG